jgi:DNA replication and repair protein RecF
VKLRRLEVRDVRNLEAVSLEPSVSTNVLCGANGQGKTSLLEAIYLVATSRSFRTHRLRELIRHGTAGGSSKAWVADALGNREQIVGVTPTQRLVRVDGQKPASMAQYAVRTPVVVFHPGELELTMGPASGRRTLMDRVALFFDAKTHGAHQAYVLAMRARQRLLQTEGPDAQGVEAYECLMARHGVEVACYRRDAVERLAKATREAFERVAPEALQLAVRYLPGGSFDEEDAKKRLFSSRRQDCRRPSSGFGPHRDDLVLEINGRLARTDASQGQHRMLTLSLKIAEMVCVGEGCGVNPVLLLDDVSSELDAERTDAFFDLLGHRKDQVFLTTTRPEMLPVYERKMGEAKVFLVDSGRITEA